MSDRQQGRKQAVGELKRGLILAAARRVFEAEGLDGASLRAIAGGRRLYPGGAVLPFRFQGGDLCRGAARLPRPAGRGGGGRRVGRQDAGPAPARRGHGLLRLLCREPRRSRSGLLSLPRRHEAQGARPGPRRGVERGFGGGARPHRRGRGRSRRQPRGGQAADGRCLRPCRRPAAAGPYRANPHVRGFGAAAHGGLCRGPDQAAHREENDEFDRARRPRPCCSSISRPASCRPSPRRRPSSSMPDDC